jgi:hypothetical protein
MKMQNVRRRVETLERSLAPKHEPTADQVIFRQTLHRLSIDDLKCLRGIAVDYQLGQLNRDLTPGESAAIAVYASAFQQELQLAGFSSMAEFQRKYCRLR